MIATEDEYVLIDRILAGEKQLYATLVDKYKSYAYTIAMKILETQLGYMNSQTLTIGQQPGR